MSRIYSWDEQALVKAETTYGAVVKPTSADAVRVLSSSIDEGGNERRIRADKRSTRSAVGVIQGQRIAVVVPAIAGQLHGSWRHRPIGVITVRVAKASIAIQVEEIRCDRVAVFVDSTVADLLGTELQLNVAVFYMDWEDFQAEVVDPSGQDCSPEEPVICDNPWLKSVGNVGDAHTAGVNVDFAWIPAAGWDVGANAQFLEAEVRRQEVDVY